LNVASDEVSVFGTATAIRILFVPTESAPVIEVCNDVVETVLSK